MTQYIIRNDSQDAWLSGRVWYAHESYADVFTDRQEADDVASIMENAFPGDRIRVIPSAIDRAAIIDAQLDELEQEVVERERDEWESLSEAY